MNAKRHYTDAAEGLRLLVCGSFMLVADLFEGLWHCLAWTVRKLFSKKEGADNNGPVEIDAQVVDVESEGQG